MDTLVTGESHFLKIKQIGHFRFKCAVNVDYSSAMGIISLNNIPFYGHGLLCGSGLSHSISIVLERV